jgi:short subunit dehydrogenase-like uncharacterized protein
LRSYEESVAYLAGRVCKDVDELRQRLGGGAQRLDLFVGDLGEVTAENVAEPSVVVLDCDAQHRVDGHLYVRLL